MTHYDNNIIKYIVGISNIYDTFTFDYNSIKSMVESIELKTRMKLYNIENLLNEINMNINNQTIEMISNIIKKNMVYETDFKDIFKSNLELSLIFIQNKPIILYKNKKVVCVGGNISSLNIENINTMLKKSDKLPEISELYIDNIMRVLNKFTNMDLSVSYYCKNIPQPIWYLFKHCSLLVPQDLDIYKYIDDIISGKLYIKNNPIIYDDMKEMEYEIKENIIDDKDIQYRMEIMVYFDDTDVTTFLDIVANLDNNPPNKNITSYLTELLDCTNKSKNQLFKIYFINRILKYIMTIETFITEQHNFRYIVDKKINELYDSLYIIQSAELSFSEEVTKTFVSARNFIDNINKNLNNINSKN
jgi:hypothetical protein